MPTMQTMTERPSPSRPGPFPGALVLVVEDDPSIRAGLVDALEFAGYRTVEAADGASGLSQALGSGCELVLLDQVLPGMDGLSVLSAIRQGRPGLGVIMVTARAAEQDRVDGLRGGADDYIVKPFSIRELLARVEALLRRSGGGPMGQGAGWIHWPGGRVDLSRGELHADGAGGAGGVVELSSREREVLVYLARRRSACVSREELLSDVWQLDPRGLHSRTVDMTIARLREKLAVVAGGEELIVTVRNRGYMLAGFAQVQA